MALIIKAPGSIPSNWHSFSVEKLKDGLNSAKYWSSEKGDHLLLDLSLQNKKFTY